MATPSKAAVRRVRKLSRPVVGSSSGGVRASTDGSVEDIAPVDGATWKLELAGLIPVERDPAPTSAVAAVIRCLAVELGEFGIRANVVAPGLILTPMMGPLDGPAAQYLVKEYAPQTPARRLGYPEDFEGIGAYLCSDASSFMTGETVIIDGGYKIRP